MDKYEKLLFQCLRCDLSLPRAAIGSVFTTTTKECGSVSLHFISPWLTYMYVCTMHIADTQNYNSGCFCTIETIKIFGVQWLVFSLSYYCLRTFLLYLMMPLFYIAKWERWNPPEWVQRCVPAPVVGMCAVPQEILCECTSDWWVGIPSSHISSSWETNPFYIVACSFLGQVLSFSSHPMHCPISCFFFPKY